MSYSIIKKYIDASISSSDTTELKTYLENLSGSKKGLLKKRRLRKKILNPSKKIPPLHYAIMAGAPLTTIQILIENGANLTSKTPDQSNILHLLVQYRLLWKRSKQKKETITLINYLFSQLREHLSDKKYRHFLNKTNQFGQNLLHILFSHYPIISTDILDILWDHISKSHGKDELGRDILDFLINKNAGDDQGNTPLHYLCMQENPNLNTIRFFLYRGLADLNIKNKDGKTPLDYIEDANLREAIKIIEEDSNWLHAACQKGVSKETIELMLERLKPSTVFVVKQDENGNTALHIICQENPVDLKKINTLLEQDIDPTVENDDKKTAFEYIEDDELRRMANYLTYPLPLLEAFQKEESVEFLISFMAHTHFDFQEEEAQKLLEKAINKNNTKLIKHLIEHDVLIQNKNLQGALSVPNIDLELLKLLAEHEDIDIKETDLLDNSLLHIAIQNKQPLEIIRYLIEDLNLDTRERNLSGLTALEIAIDKQAPSDIIELNLSTLHEKNPVSKKYPIVRAIETENLEIITFLIEKNSPINIDVDYKPLICWAIDQQVKPELFQVIVDATRDVHQILDDKKSLLKYAKKNGDKFKKSYRDILKTKIKTELKTTKKTLSKSLSTIIITKTSKPSEKPKMRHSRSQVIRLKPERSSDRLIELENDINIVRLRVKQLKKSPEDKNLRYSVLKALLPNLVQEINKYLERHSIERTEIRKKLRRNRFKDVLTLTKTLEKMLPNFPEETAKPTLELLQTLYNKAILEVPHPSVNFYGSELVSLQDIVDQKWSDCMHDLEIHSDKKTQANRLSHIRSIIKLFQKKCDRLHESDNEQELLPSIDQLYNVKKKIDFILGNFKTAYSPKKGHKKLRVQINKLEKNWKTLSSTFYRQQIILAHKNSNQNHFRKILEHLTDIPEQIETLFHRITAKEKEALDNILWQSPFTLRILQNLNTTNQKHLIRTAKLIQASFVNYSLKKSLLAPFQIFHHTTTKTDSLKTTTHNGWLYPSLHLRGMI